MRWLAGLCAAVVLGAGASPVSAAFAGGIGQLVIAPWRSPGLLLVSPDGHGASRVCDAPQICGRPLTPRFAANGRQLLFTDQRSGRIEMADAGGACLWCLNDPPLAPLPGTSASFTPDGRAITFVGKRSDPGLWMFTFATDVAHRLVRLVNGPVSSAGRSGTGALVWARRGWVWEGRLDLELTDVHRETRGGEPALSPAGRELAFTRNRSVYVMNLATTGVTRVGAGSAAAFSPDGRTLAYVAPDHAVVLKRLAGGRSRTLPGIRARSVDWQPLSAVTTGSCATAKGAVVASTSEATVRALHDPEARHTLWTGCLTALGVPFPLHSAFADTTLDRTALAGTFAALQFESRDIQGDVSDYLIVYDLRTGAEVRSATATCRGLPCDVTDLAVDSDGFAAWRAVDTPSPPGNGITPPGLAETLGTLDDTGSRTVDTAPPGSGTVIAGLRLSGDTLTWTHGGAPRQATLR